MANILVTGAAGFIGFHLARRLLERGDRVFGLDNLNGYYDVHLKHARLRQLQDHADFHFARLDLKDAAGLDRLFTHEGVESVVHLAAQAGVRHSIDQPHAYVDSNVVGFLNVLECCRRHPVRHLVYASSSSVYGANVKLPFSVDDAVDHPVSLYAATKKANELMAHCYSHLYGIPTTGLRFFTVYGPWGRPDMSPFLFTRAILGGETIKVFNNGDMARDFTYIDDIVEGMERVLGRAPTPTAGDELSPGRSPTAPYRIYNIGNHQPVRLLDFIETLERALGIEARKEFLPMQPGDVVSTCADIRDLEQEVGFRPSTPLEVGITRFVAWYREYHGAKPGDTARPRVA